MNRKDILKMCIQNLKRRRSRTLLTLLGVLIGCCSIVIMVSIGIGMAESQNRMLAEMGDLTIITVTPKQNGKGKIKLNDSALGQMCIRDRDSTISGTASMWTCCIFPTRMPCSSPGSSGTANTPI